MADEQRRSNATHDQTLGALTCGSAEHRRIVIRGATVISMDPAVGDLVRGDVHIDGQMIESVQPHRPENGAYDDAIVVPAEGCIVIPGLQDTHRHCWQTQLRTMFAAVDLDHYVDVAHARLAPQYSEDDIHIATLLADLGAIEGGVTALLDFAHNSRSVGHAEAALQAHTESGIRAIIAVAPPLSGDRDFLWPDDVSRLAAARQHHRVGLAYGVFGTSDLGGDRIALTPENVLRARDLGLPIVVDATFGPSASSNIERLGADGLLGPDITLIHCTALTTRAWECIQDFGVHVSLATTSDAEIGIFDANPPIQEALRREVKPGLSVDVECSLSSDLFAQMRATYTIQRMQAFGAKAREDKTPAPVTPRRILEMATIDGARVNRLDDISGSITPGKRADLAVVSADGFSTMPMNNAVSSIVLGTDTAAVRDVFIDGEVRKWQGRVVGVDLQTIRDRVVGSRDKLLALANYAPDPLA